MNRISYHFTEMIPPDFSLLPIYLTQNFHNRLCQEPILYWFINMDSVFLVGNEEMWIKCNDEDKTGYMGVSGNFFAIFGIYEF
ncbi:hypothetical protein ADM99_00640 [Leptolinea tardivitalis]|uniref:Uncharacterized protein n=1 Tax=Leptolinea tardivitalis TaxID=229920 RepID=A0A0P6XJJ7_9CHLR|nr:hypothetical protein ADM99_00640 [Leptolinea tardivitalis]